MSGTLNCSICGAALFQWGEQGSHHNIADQHKQWHEDLERRIAAAAQVGAHPDEDDQTARRLNT